MKSSDSIHLQIPIKAEFVSIARLTASGIANRIGFDIDTIEDIKVAISEVLGKIIEKNASAGSMNMEFVCSEKSLSITVKVMNRDLSDLFSDNKDKIALSIISSLMDEIKLEKQEYTVITMVKNLGKAV